MAASREAIMRRVKAMLDRADHPNTPPEEAATARAMAEKMIMKHRIDEEEAYARGDVKAADAITVQDRFMDVAPIDSKYMRIYTILFSYCMRHVGAEAVITGYRTDPMSGVTVRQCRVFGYESDLAYAEMLFTNARLYFAARMEPTVDPSLSDEENVYALRQSGMERIRIAETMGWGTTGSATAKVTRLYKKACAARNEDPTLTGRGMSVKDYREQYAVSFCAELWQRLAQARNAVDAEITDGLVLHNRGERVKEALFTAYPDLRPKPTTDRMPATKARAYKWTKADQKRWERENSPAAQAGRSAGRSAAQQVHIDGTTPKRRLSDN